MPISTKWSDYMYREANFLQSYTNVLYIFLHQYFLVELNYKHNQTHDVQTTQATNTNLHKSFDVYPRYMCLARYGRACTQLLNTLVLVGSIKLQTQPNTRCTNYKSYKHKQTYTRALTCLSSLHVLGTIWTSLHSIAQDISTCWFN